MAIEFVEGMRVRLTCDLKGATAGQTGYLHKTSPDGSWGVVFDHEADFDMMTTHISDETPDGIRVKLLDVVAPIEAAMPLEQGRRVRLLEPLDDGKYQSGDTGYLHCWLRDGCDERDSWGVVFDKNGDDGHTVVRGTRPDGSIVLLVDAMEYLQIATDEPECPAYFG